MGEFLEDLAGDEVVTWGFVWMKTEDGCMDFSSCEARDRQVKLIGSLQKLKKGFICCGVGTRGVMPLIALIFVFHSMPVHSHNPLRCRPDGTAYSARL
jgi:hypothetical protein